MTSKVKKEYDLLAHIRKPHGIAILIMAVGIVAWAMWTLWAA